MMNEPLEITFKVTTFFEKHDIPYLIGGSLASALYGRVRTTQDSDIIAMMRLEHIPLFVSELQLEFYVDPEMIEDALIQHTSFNLIHRDTMFKVDVFTPEPSPFIESELLRVRSKKFSFEKNETAKFASPEDIILAKLEWFRSGGEVSEIQWQDIIGVFKANAGELDLEYLRHWANELKISDLLTRALKFENG